MFLRKFKGTVLGAKVRAFNMRESLDHNQPGCAISRV